MSIKSSLTLFSRLTPAPKKIPERNRYLIVNWLKLYKTGTKKILYYTNSVSLLLRNDRNYFYACLHQVSSSIRPKTIRLVAIYLHKYMSTQFVSGIKFSVVSKAIHLNLNKINWRLIKAHLTIGYYQASFTIVTMNNVLHSTINRSSDKQVDSQTQNTKRIGNMSTVHPIYWWNRCAVNLMVIANSNENGAVWKQKMWHVCVELRRYVFDCTPIQECPLITDSGNPFFFPIILSKFFNISTKVSLANRNEEMVISMWKLQ